MDITYIKNNSLQVTTGVGNNATKTPLVSDISSAEITLPGSGYAIPSRPIGNQNKKIHSSGVAIFEENGKKGLKDSHGNVIIPAQMDQVKFGYSFEGPRVAPPVIYTKDGLNGIALPPNKQDSEWAVIPPNYKELFPNSVGTVEATTIDGKNVILDRSNKVLSTYDEVLGRNNNYETIKRNGKIGIIDVSTGKEVLPIEYDKIENTYANGIGKYTNEKGTGYFVDLGGFPYILAKPEEGKVIKGFESPMNLSNEGTNFMNSSSQRMSTINTLNKDRVVNNLFLVTNRDGSETLALIDPSSMQITTVVPEGIYKSISYHTEELDNGVSVLSGYLDLKTMDGKSGLGKINDKGQLEVTHEPCKEGYKYYIEFTWDSTENYITGIKEETILKNTKEDDQNYLRRKMIEQMQQNIRKHRE